MNPKPKFSLLIILLCVICSVYAQKNHWKEISFTKSITKGVSKFHLEADKVHYFELQTDAFISSLSSAPSRSSGVLSSTKIIVPGFEGALEEFILYEAPVFEASLSAAYPNIKSFIGYNKATGSVLRMSTSPEGVQTMIMYLDKEPIFMMPISHGANNYLVYNKSSRGAYEDSFTCTTENEVLKAIDDNNLTNRDANDQLLRSYRLAMSVNAEYTQYFGGTVAGALAAINATLTRVNAVFETDMAITFIVQNFPQLIYTNSETDPYTNIGSWNSELQNTLNTTIGNAAYDIGHMFGASGGGGSAGCIGCVCEPNIKGSGKTSPADGVPEGDNFDIDYVAHEIGHQMGANHTFSHNLEGAGVNVEPGSGTTIMGYAGITGSNNVEFHSDAYFHYVSIEQILNNVATSPNDCAITTPISNLPPVVDAGPDYVIPKGTAYVLRASASDSNGGDILTYCWEEIDNGQVTNSSFGPDLLFGSMNRSLSPSTSPNRYIPKMSRIAAGELTETSPTVGSDWETVSNVARTLNWAVTARDRQPTTLGLGGQTAYDDTVVTVVDTTPFTMSSPNGGESWVEGTSETVTWNVGTTTSSPINCQFVDIKLSTDGGLTYPITLASSTPNDGSEVITVPEVNANVSSVRIMVEAADNIFLDVSNSNFNIIDTSSPDFYFTNLSGNVITCSSDSVTFNLDYNTLNGFNETVTFSASGNPASTVVSFSPSSVNSDGTIQMTVSGINNIVLGSYTITVSATGTSITKTIDVMLTKSDGICNSVANTNYDTSTTLVQFGTINNASGKPSGYSDYTSISTNVNRESTYDLTVNMNTDSSPTNSYTCITTVWIDWNQDCDFDDPNEVYDLGSANGVSDGPSSNSPLTITIPDDAVLGNTIMRVSTKYNSAAASCDNDYDGEVEDYTVNVQEPLTLEDFESSYFTIYPNPNNGSFTISSDKIIDDVNIEVYDIRGRKVYNELYRNFENETIRLNAVQSGMYLLNIISGNKKVTKKIIIQ